MPASWAESAPVAPDRSDAGEVCRQELDAVSVELPRALVIAACRSEWGLMCRGMQAALAIRATMR